MDFLQGGVRLGSVRGIEVTADRSVVIIFGLISFSLGAGLFPVWHPDWPTAAVWATAVMAALAFFVSLFLHELSHALVGRANGIHIRQITLFMFGGVAHMDNEPPSWKAEFAMAIVGPITSVVLGLSLLALGDWLAGPLRVDPRHPEQVFAQLGPLTTLLAWLGPINLILAIFNLVPAFPLDGGRVLRALLWGGGGDLLGATRWASLGGRWFAGALIAGGFLMMLGVRMPLFGAGIGNGFWLMLIGGFLHQAARDGYRQLLARQALAAVPVRRLMIIEAARLAPDFPARGLRDDRGRIYPVEEDGRLLGLVSTGHTAVGGHETTVAEIMVPLRRLVTLGPAGRADEALELLGRHDVDRLPVVEQGRFLGWLRREDIDRWLSRFGAARSSRRA